MDKSSFCLILTFTNLKEVTIDIIGVDSPQGKLSGQPCGSEFTVSEK